MSFVGTEPVLKARRVLVIEDVAENLRLPFFVRQIVDFLNGTA